jgi:hypothetical protein
MVPEMAVLRIRCRRSKRTCEWMAKASDRGEVSVMLDCDLSLEKLVPVARLTIFDVLHLHPQPGSSAPY